MKAVTTEAQYKQYFSGSFQGMNSLIDDVLSPIFGKFTSTTDPKGVDYVNVYGNEGANIDHIYDYGKFYTDNTDVSVFEVVLSERCHISRARKGIRKAVGRITEQYSGAFIVFHYPERSANAEAQTWRLSWLKRLDVHKTDSPAKRYTYLCGPEYSCRTIAQRFNDLYKEKNKTLDSITKAFDAEALSDEFFKEYKVLYDDIVQWITGQRVIKKDNKWQEKGSFGSGNGKDICDDFLKEFDNIEETKEKERLASKAIRDYVKKMLGRLVFIQFLQKKGYLGIDGKPTQNFLLDLFNCITDEQKDNFIDTALEQVVYLLLNSDDRKPGSEVINKHTLEVPFLNGGLFECDRWDEIDVTIPKEFFHNEQYEEVKREFGSTELRPDDKFLTQCGILDLFNHYNFTIDENDPDDAELGVDPEMLGKIFENLLEDNKDKGAFYTPKEIVQYMCRESLIAYLQTGIEDEGTKDAIRQFVTTQEIGEKLPKDIDRKLQEVKICDPAIGSGAFPMGLLSLLVALREKLEPANNRCELKKDIIQKNIYGVDIERGAIDIARLRFWLSIMVDEDSPTPLPNFDYKFMQGNSLLEQYKGIDLSTLSSGEKVSMQTDIFQNNLKQFQSQLHSLIELYYNTDNHIDKKKLKKEIQDNVNNQMKASGVSVNFTELGIDVAGNDQFFLWHTWFQDVFDNGNFDIVIGNPPYGAHLGEKEKALLKKDYITAKTIQGVQKGSMDTYTLFIEKGYKILGKKSILSYIVPISFTSSDALTGVHKLLMDNCAEIRVSSYAVRPEPVFPNAVVNSSIIMFRKTMTPYKHLYSTKMHRRKGVEFSLQRLIDNLQFVDVKDLELYGRIPKIGSDIEIDILNKLLNFSRVGKYIKSKGSPIVYRFAGGRYFKVITNYSNGSSAERTIYFDEQSFANAIGCILSSNLSFWFYQIFSDNLNWKNYEIESFTLPTLSEDNIDYLNKLYNRYLNDIEANANIRKTTGKSSYNVASFKEYKIVHSKAIIDEIDDYIGPLYGLTQEEISFIKNYELEFRLAGE